MTASVSIVAILQGQVILVSDRFDEKVHKGEGCWEWQGGVNRNGYGRYSINSVWQVAHRLSFRFAYGPIPDGLYVCHRCDNRKCVRSDHLFTGTHLDNMRDMVSKGRAVSPAISQPGEANPASVLTERDVRLIRRLIVSGVRQTTLAGAFDVSLSAINDIVHGRRWKHVV